MIGFKSINRAPAKAGMTAGWALGLSLLTVSCGGTHWQPATAPDPDLEPLAADHTEGDTSFTIYHNIVRTKVMNAFTALNHGDPSEALALMDDDVVYTFEGSHALGGTRRSKKAVGVWFRRLLHLVPSRFEIRELEVSGWPWNTRVYLSFVDHVKPLKGQPYTNQGVQISYLSWGSAYRIHTYVNTALLENALDHMGREGVAQAVAPPITD